MKRLSEVCTINMGQSPSSLFYNAEGKGLPFFQGNADFGVRSPITRIWCTEPVKIAEKGDLLISVRAPIGAVNMAKERCCIGRGLAAIKPNTEICDINYLWYFLKSRNRELNHKGTGSTFKAISKQDLCEISIHLPELEEQKRIAQILDKINSLIEGRERQTIQIENLIKVRFADMFDNKFPKVKIGDRFQTLSGGTPLKSHAEYYKNGIIPWITSGEVNAGMIDRAKNFITEAGLSNSSARIVPENSVLIAMYGATAGQVGLLKIPASTNQAVCALLPHSEYEPEYIYFAVKSKKKWMISQCAGGAQPNMSQAVIRRMEIVDAPIKAQKEFSDFFRQAEQLKSVILTSQNKLQLLYQASMQQYFEIVFA